MICLGRADRAWPVGHVHLHFCCLILRYVVGKLQVDVDAHHAYDVFSECSKFASYSRCRANPTFCFPVALLHEWNSIVVHVCP